ncbi:uncharacterized protein KY384_004262 [Bacidia gigantensis]|uniref:uncharacterized protein n=1 Tax=Bacidia gigantensis TaxID=2732470 RepID=UPI001D045875|nr:uncharacterized protein KY384_004262 [Bacidia gigantensis]KAG8530905.1 hypothetical protein KY384_004262 [Bacidia gigantensis]
MTSQDGPSTISIALATAILSVATGYLIGSASSIGVFGSSSTARKAAKKSWPNSYDVTIHPDSSDEELMKQLGRKQSKEVKDSEEEDEADSSEEEVVGELATFEGNKEECKLVLVVRTDLGMGKGKIAAQASHATLACYTTLRTSHPNHPVLRRWESFGAAKIAVQAQSEEELLVLQAQAISLGLCARIIHDAGRTQIASGTATVLGVGPAPKSVVDQVTGKLKLL